MQLSELQQEIDQANQLSSNLITESMRIPSLHGKFLNIKSGEYLLLKKLEMELETLELERWMFYTGKASPEQYKQEKFELKLLKTDVDIFMKADVKIQTVRGKIEIQKQKVVLCDEMVRALNQRTFVIKNIIDMKKFENGVV